MKKLIAVAAILSVMFLGAGTSHALLGVPDAVPGEDILIPFFIVSMTGTDNCLITITDVNGFGAVDCLHLRLYDVNSVEVYNDEVTMTPFDVYVTDARDIIENQMSPAGRIALEVDLDGDTVNDHWVGYMHFQNETVASANYFIAHVYQVDLAAGMVAGYTGVSLEDATAVADACLEAYSGLGVDFVGLEAFSADALLEASAWLTTGLTGGGALTAEWFRLMPRVYVADNTVNSTNLIIIWTDVEPGISVVGPLHLNFFDEEENCTSSPFDIPDELSIIDVKDVFPLGLTNVPPAAYIAGWIDIVTPDLSLPPTGFDGERLWLGYSLQRAAMADGTTLDVILEAHRDAGTGVSPRP